MVCMQAANGATALHNAAGGGFEVVVKALLAANADTDVQNTNCNTALHLAAGKGELLTVCERQPGFLGIPDQQSVLLLRSSL